jgi:predicted ABC-type ATPase
MFAGPNGSGKTTIKLGLQRPDAWFGIYINPDDLEREMRETGFLPLAAWGLTAETEELQAYFERSALLTAHALQDQATLVECRDSGIDCSRLPVNSYHASVIADFLRRKALAAGRSFSFETVMSSPDKVNLLREAQREGFRTYLYFVATEDPAINIARVKRRAAEGGHDVPEDKIISRYDRSLRLLPQAIRHSNRAFLFDTSEESSWYFAECEDGTRIELKSTEIPNWFRPIWEQF